MSSNFPRDVASTRPRFIENYSTSLVCAPLPGYRTAASGIGQGQRYDSGPILGAKEPLSEEDIRLIFTLLDAADANGSLSREQRERWRDLKDRFGTRAPAEDGLALYDLLAEHCDSDPNREGWIQARWQALRARRETERRQEWRRPPGFSDRPREGAAHGHS